MTDTQKTDIVRHMLKYGYITAEQAMEHYKIYRLSARIHELKDIFDLGEQWVYGKTPHGRTCRWKEYLLPHEERERAKEWLKGGDGLRLKDGCLPKQS